MELLEGMAAGGMSVLVIAICRLLLAVLRRGIEPARSE